MNEALNHLQENWDWWVFGIGALAGWILHP
jgi:hypothetical protein